MSASSPVIPFDVDFDTVPNEVPHLQLSGPHIAAAGLGAAPIVLPLLALAVSCAGLGLAVANFLGGKETKAKLAELQQGLGRLELGQIDILNELKDLRNEVEWSQIVTMIGGPVARIQYFYDCMNALLPKQEWSQPQIDSWLEHNKTNITQWAEAVVADSDGVRMQISVMNSALQGTGGLTKPLMEIVVQKILSSRWLTQSQFFFGRVKFQSILWYEAQAIGILTAAYKLLNPAATEQEITDYTALYRTQYEKQITDSSPYFERLKRFWTPWPTSITQDAPINWDKFGIVYIDPHQVQTDDGFVVVGLQFYKKGNRLALCIEQAQLDQAGEIQASTRRKKMNPDWGETYFQVGANTELTPMTTSVPAGEVATMVTGVQLQIQDNKIMTLLEYVPFDPKTGTADFTQRKWTVGSAALETPGEHWFSSDPDGKVPNNSLRGRVGTQYSATPNPLEAIVAVELLCQKGPGSPFLSIGVAAR
jgi:hypothetical protein